MKRVCFFVILFSLSGTAFTQSVSVGSSNSNPAAILSINSADKGFLPPRLTLAQRNAIQKPATGLMIWCIDCDEMQVYNGNMWINMSGMAGALNSSSGIRICYHNWMYKNLAVRTYRNGDTIPVVTDPVVWANLTTGAMCWYNNDSSAYNSSYGALYNWYAVNDPRGLAPAGWHIPKNIEWNILSNCLGGDSIAGGKMKDLLLWSTPNTGASNTSGFSALPAGMRTGNGNFVNINNNAYWWGREQNNTSTSMYRFLFYQNRILSNTTISKNAGLSIRCLKD